MSSEELLKKYSCTIKSFEDKVKGLKKNTPYKGHLINLKDFEDLKNKVDYKKYKNCYYPKIEIKDCDKKYMYKDLEIKSSQYLINMLLNENKYIIIDTSFYQLICEKGKKNSEPFEYTYLNNSNDLKLTFGGRDVINFTKMEINNKIDSTKLKNKSSNNFEDIKKTYESIKKYYNFEISLEKDLKSKQKTNKSNKGYLIEKEAIDKWKEKIQYDIFKKEYFSKSNIDKEAKDKLIYIFEKKNIKFFDLIDIKKNELNTKQKVEEYIKTKSLILVNSDFISSLGKQNILKEIEYIIYDNTIDIIFDSNNSLLFKAKDNIIESNPNLDGNINNIENKKVDTQNNDNNNNFANN